MPLYGTLRTTNPSYDAALLQELEDLYIGGYQIIRNSKRYLTQMVGEGAERFDERCNITSYQPFFGQIINNFMSALFGQPLDVKPAADASNPDSPGSLPVDKAIYHQFTKNCDQKGGTFLDLMKGVLITALKTRSAIVHIDAPKTSEDPVTLAEEEALGSDRV